MYCGLQLKEIKVFLASANEERDLGASKADEAFTKEELSSISATAAKHLQRMAEQTRAAARHAPAPHAWAALV